MKNVCDTHGMNHEEFKLWADKYFFIPHRNETRGVGGIFYDYQKPSEEKSMEALWELLAKDLDYEPPPR